MNKRSKCSTEQGGYVLLGVLVTMALALLVTVGMLESSASQAKTRALVTTQADYYYEVEESLNRVVGWLQDHSDDLVTAFTTANFNANFDLGNPAIGDNEGEHFEVPTLVKMKGTNSSVMLSNNSFFGQAAFPNTTNIVSGAAFNPIDSFSSADLGEANARIVLVWARQTTGVFEPIFRIDVVTGNNPDRGVHSYSYVYTTVETSSGGLGFYGRDWMNLQTPNNTCGSYSYTNVAGVWNAGAPRANCAVNSDGTLSSRAKINGTANSLLNNGVIFHSPTGDATAGVCEGTGCHSLTLPTVNTWSGYCAVHAGNLTINADTTLSAGGCWQDVTIANNRTLRLSDTAAPYYFRNINYGGNNARIEFGPVGGVPVNSKVTVYAEQFDANGNNHINGNKMFNMSNAPHQLELYYLGTADLTLNGNVSMNSVIYAPNAQVNVLGNFIYNGSIQAKRLDISGNARLYYDEQLGGTPVVTDMNFALRKTSQRYR